MLDQSAVRSNDPDAEVRMVAEVKAVTPDQYQQWIRRQKANIHKANVAVAAAHKKLAADPQATP